MSQSLESFHRSLHKHNRKWDVCGKGSGEGAGVRTMECGSGLAPLLSTELHRRPRREGPGSQPHLIHEALKEGPWRSLRPNFPPPPSMSIWGN